MSAAGLSFSTELQQIFGNFHDVAPMLGRLNADGHVIGISQSPTPSSTGIDQQSGSSSSQKSCSQPQQQSSSSKARAKAKPQVANGDRERDKDRLRERDSERAENKAEKPSSCWSSSQPSSSSSSKSVGEAKCNDAKSSSRKDKEQSRSRGAVDKRASAFRSVPSTSKASAGTAKAGAMLKSCKATALKMRAPLKIDVKPKVVVVSATFESSASPSASDHDRDTARHTTPPPISPRKAVQSMTSLLATPLSTIPSDHVTFDFSRLPDDEQLGGKQETAAGEKSSKGRGLQEDLALSEDSDSDNEHQHKTITPVMVPETTVPTKTVAEKLVNASKSMEDPWDLDCIMGISDTKPVPNTDAPTTAPPPKTAVDSPKKKTEAKTKVVVKKEAESSKASGSVKKAKSKLEKMGRIPRKESKREMLSVVVTGDEEKERSDMAVAVVQCTSGASSDVSSSVTVQVDVVTCRIRLDLLTNDLRLRMLSPLQSVPECLRASSTSADSLIEHATNDVLVKESPAGSAGVPCTKSPAASVTVSQPSTVSKEHNATPAGSAVPKKRKLPSKTADSIKDPEEPLDKRKAPNECSSSKPHDKHAKRVKQSAKCNDKDKDNQVQIIKEKHHKSAKRPKTEHRSDGHSERSSEPSAKVTAAAHIKAESPPTLTKEVNREPKREFVAETKVEVIDTNEGHSADTHRPPSTTADTPSAPVNESAPVPSNAVLGSSNKGTAALPVGKVEPILNTAAPIALAPQRPAHVDSDSALAPFEHYQNTLARPTKHKAQLQTEHMTRMLLYLEAIVHFISACRRLKMDKPTSTRPFQMLKDTNELLKDVSSRFQTASSALNSKSKAHVAKVQVLCLRTQAVLHRHMYLMFRDKALRNAQWLSEHQQAPSTTLLISTPQIGNPTTGSNSTPSPTSSTGSSNALPPGHVLVLQQVEQVQRLQLGFLNNLMMADYLWQQADQKLTTEHKDFFAHVDKVCGSVRHDSALYELSVYVLTAIKWMRVIIDTTPSVSGPSSDTSAASQCQ